MKLNINDRIKVRLKTAGEKIHFDYYYKYLQNTRPLKECLPKEDEEGYTQYQIWEFAQIFGEHLYNGAEQVIKDNEIVIVGDGQKRFTPMEVDTALVIHGQHDLQFKLGETIKYSPSDVRKILLGEM